MGTSERVSADGGARNAVARRTHRRGGVDGGIDGFGHDSDDFGPGNGVASDSGGRDGEAKWRGRIVGRVGALGQRRGTARRRCVRTAAVRTAMSERLLSRPARSDTAAHSSQSGHGTARHCH
jgi:hypothetical protein